MACPLHLQCRSAASAERRAECELDESMSSTSTRRPRARQLLSLAPSDNIMRDVRYACPSSRLAPPAAVTIVMTVGLGLGLIAAVFTMLNAVVFQADEVRAPQELFAVVRTASADSEAEPFTRAEYEALLRETDAFSA